MSNKTVVSLKPQDVGVLLKVVSLGRTRWVQADLARQLNMPAGSINQSLKRAALCNLFNLKTKTVQVEALKDFLRSGIRYVFPGIRGKQVRGIPTASGAPPLSLKMANEALLWPPVWSSPYGKQQGYEIAPLLVSVESIVQDSLFYELMTLTDALREGRSREHAEAYSELVSRLSDYQAMMKRVK